jgi:hypothetical protein
MQSRIYASGSFAERKKSLDEPSISIDSKYRYVSYFAFPFQCSVSLSVNSYDTMTIDRAYVHRISMRLFDRINNTLKYLRARARAHAPSCCIRE